jgi:hypothetical protein
MSVIRRHLLDHLNRMLGPDLAALNADFAAHGPVKSMQDEALPDHSKGFVQVIWKSALSR